MKNRQHYIKTTVSSINKISATGYLLQIRYSISWVPGQVVGIKLQSDQKSRLYSIAGSDDPEQLTILFTEKPDGMLTPLLSELKSGDSIYVSSPFGKFIPAADNAWWICNGTGIAPFRGLWQQHSISDIKLIHGVKQPGDKYFYQEIKKTSGITYTACLSQESTEEDYDGRVTEYLQNMESLPASANYYLCGSAEMSVEVRDILISKGIPYTNIHTEIYF